MTRCLRRRWVGGLVGVETLARRRLTRRLNSRRLIRNIKNWYRLIPVIRSNRAGVGIVRPVGLFVLGT